jgi:hypothetical protein
MVTGIPMTTTIESSIEAFPEELAQNTEAAASQFLSLNRYSPAWPARLSVLVSRSRETGR